MSSTTSLPAIITAARAGALDHAERLFVASGLARRTDDPAALAVHGRLLKDRAALLPAAERPAAFARAAATYAAADRIAPQPYTRINVATLTLLSGDRAEAQRIARDIIAWIESDPAIRETPYYLAATRAEAHMLCGETERARTALADALSRSPFAYEDHASTLRQLELIARFTGQDARWLDDFRPPRVVQFAGHLAIGSPADPDIIEQIDAVLEKERIGFAFGALAAGSDIVIAERVLARDGELHVILPLASEAFCRQSVDPFGADWRTRYDMLQEAATSWAETAHDTGEYEPLATDLGADVAMGAAARHARHLAGEAVQLVIVDTGPGEYGEGRQTARLAQRWVAAGRRTHVIRVPRETKVVASGRRSPEGRADRRLAAMLQIDVVGLPDLDEVGFADAVDNVLAPLRSVMADPDLTPDVVLPAGNSRLVAFAEPEAAYEFARRLLNGHYGSLPLKVAGHYGLAHWLNDPPALVGRTVAELGAIAAAGLPGTMTVSEGFASSLFLGAQEGIFAEPVGEVDGQRIYAMRTALDQ